MLTNTEVSIGAGSGSNGSELPKRSSSYSEEVFENILVPNRKSRDAKNDENRRD